MIVTCPYCEKGVDTPFDDCRRVSRDTVYGESVKCPECDLRFGVLDPKTYRGQF